VRVKYNIDASFSSHNNKSVFGICIRNKYGAFILAKTEWLTPICPIYIGDALGFLSALKLIYELNLEPVDL
jgi:hypothetical protein